MPRKPLFLVLALLLAALAAPFGIADGPKASGKKAAAPTRAEVIVRAMRRLDEDCAHHDAGHERAAPHLHALDRVAVLPPRPLRHEGHRPRRPPRQGPRHDRPLRRRRGGRVRAAVEGRRPDGGLRVEPDDVVARRGGDPLRRARGPRPAQGGGDPAPAADRRPAREAPAARRRLRPRQGGAAAHSRDPDARRHLDEVPRDAPLGLELGLHRARPRAPAGGQEARRRRREGEGVLHRVGLHHGHLSVRPEPEGLLVRRRRTQAARTAGWYVALRALGVPAREKSLARTASFLGARRPTSPRATARRPTASSSARSRRSSWAARRARSSRRRSCPASSRPRTRRRARSTASVARGRHDLRVVQERRERRHEDDGRRLGRLGARVRQRAEPVRAPRGEGEAKLLDGLPPDAGGSDAATTPSDTTPGGDPLRAARPP